MTQTQIVTTLILIILWLVFITLNLVMDLRKEKNGVSITAR